VAESLVRALTPVEFFKEQVEAACERQRVAPQPLTAYYVVSLLCDFTHLGQSAAGEVMASSESLAVRLARALQSGGSDQRVGLKQVGDVSLFVSGFFSDSLRRTLVDVEYYVSIGGYAYGSLSTVDNTLAPIYAELAEKFVAFVDVLSDVSERTSMTNDRDLLRLYERWVRTGSPRNGQLLAEQGIVPNASFVKAARRLQ
jgi:hypothetical protein